MRCHSVLVVDISNRDLCRPHAYIQRPSLLRSAAADISSQLTNTLSLYEPTNTQSLCRHHGLCAVAYQHLVYVVRLRSLPTRLRSLPTRLRSLPTRLRSLPTRLQSSPTRLRSLPTSLRSLPTRLRSSPTSH